MRRIAEVLGDVQVVAAYMQMVSMVRRPTVRLEFRHIEDQAWVGPILIAHPDPDDAMAFLGGVSVDIGGRRQIVLPRHAHAATIGSEGHPMVAALHVIADDPAFGERQIAVGAAVFQSDNVACFSAIADDASLQHYKRSQRAVEISRPSRHVPSIPHIIHTLSPRRGLDRSANLA